jgi:hypothetical protein
MMSHLFRRFLVFSQRFSFATMAAVWKSLLLLHLGLSCTAALEAGRPWRKPWWQMADDIVTYYYS